MDAGTLLKMFILCCFYSMNPVSDTATIALGQTNYLPLKPVTLSGPNHFDTETKHRLQHIGQSCRMSIFLTESKSSKLDIPL